MVWTSIASIVTSPEGRTPVSQPSPVIVALVCGLRIGGLERLLVDWLIAMQGVASGKAILIVLNQDYDEALLASLRVHQVEVLLIGRRPGDRSMRPVIALMQALRKLRPDILHVHDYAGQRLAVMARLILPDMRIFATVHGLEEVRGYASWYRIAANFLHFQFIAISGAVAADCKEHGLRKCQVIENGVQLAPYRAIRRVRDTLPDIRVICVGRLSPATKGQDVLLYALNDMRARGWRATCRFLGGTASQNEDDRAWLERLADELGLGDSVEFIMDVTEIAPVLDQSNLFVLPSRSEGFGIAIVEAMSSGLPVIASDVGGVGEIVEDGVTGFLVPPDDPKALALKILQVAQAADLAPLISAAAARAEDYSIEVMRDRHLEAYARSES
jgi:glycosyltransferase involved in cell wall biosynthesis